MGALAAVPMRIQPAARFTVRQGGVAAIDPLARHEVAVVVDDYLVRAEHFRVD